MRLLIIALLIVATSADARTLTDGGRGAVELCLRQAPGERSSAVLTMQVLDAQGATIRTTAIDLVEENLTPQERDRLRQVLRGAIDRVNAKEQIPDVGPSVTFATPTPSRTP